MRGRWMDRFVFLPFSVGCVSQSSVAVCENQQKGSQAEAAQATPSGGDGEGQPTGKHKNSHTTSVLLPLPRPNISEGLQKLVKSFKSISQYFVFHKEEDDDDDEDVEMEIGFPTDVQHVAHIGWDGLSSVGSKKSSWDKSHPDQLLPFPSFSLKQVELAMAAQAGGPASHGPRGPWPK